MLHAQHVMLYTCQSQAKSYGKNPKKHAICGAEMCFATETS
jgi:hypothetical protein